MSPWKGEGRLSVFLVFRINEERDRGGHLREDFNVLSHGTFWTLLLLSALSGLTLGWWHILHDPVRENIVNGLLVCPRGVGLTL